jgi:membrane protease YdiL (CAAX protease family)
MGSSTRGVVWFLGLAFGAAWLWFVVLWLMRASLISPAGQLLLLPGGFAPAAAAIVVRKWVTREGFADAALGIQLRTWPYLLVAWVYPLAVVGAVVLLAGWLGFGWPNGSLAVALRPLLPEGAEVPDLPVVVVVPQLMLTAILVIPLLWGEEFGWRGYLQPRLFPGQPLAAAAATGIIWGVWHYPVLVMGYNFPEHRAAGLLVFPVSTMFVSVIFGWLLSRSRSVWAPSLAHASLNAVGGTLTVFLYPDPGQWIFTGVLGVLGWVPLAAICIVLYSVGCRPARPTAEGRGPTQPQHPTGTA